MPEAPITPQARSAIQDSLNLKLVFGISLLLSLWLIAIDPLINRDGIIYLRAAEAYLRDGLLASRGVFGQPLLSVTMGVLHQLTGLSLLYCGHLIITLSYALLCCGFVAAMQRLGANRMIQIIAAAVILSHPMLNEHRSDIVRDPPYWATMIFAFHTLLRYVRRPSLGLQCQWLGLVMLASMIRFEGLLFASLAPLALLLCHHREARLGNVLRLLVLPFITVLLAAVVWYYEELLSPVNRLFPTIGKHLSSIAVFPVEFKSTVRDTGTALLKFHSQDDAGIATVAGLAAILVLNLIRAMTWPYTLLLGWYFWRGKQYSLPSRQRCLINGHLLVPLFYLAVFTLVNRFMLERYSGIFTLFMLPYLCFALGSLWRHGRHRASRIIAVLLLLAMVGDTLHNDNHRKRYVREAIDWLRENTAEDIALLSNQRQLIYFSGKSYQWRRGKPVNDLFPVSQLLETPSMRCGYDYMAIDVRPGTEAQWVAFLTRYRLEEHKAFYGGEHGRIVFVDLRESPEPEECGVSPT